MDKKPFSQLRDTSILWAINRYLFHPRGYALAFHYDGDGPRPDGEPTGWSLLGDGSTIWSFTEGDDDKHFAEFEAFLNTITKNDDS